MTDRLKRLLEARATAWQSAQDIRARAEAETRDFNADEDTTYRAALDDVERLSADIETEERAERLGRTVDSFPADQRSTNPRTGAEQERQERQEEDPEAEYRDAFSSFLRRGQGRLNAEQQALLERGRSDDREVRAQGEAVGAAGGFLVPETFLLRMQEAMKAYGGILGVAEIINTATGNTLRWPLNDDTSNKGAILDENTQVTEQDFSFSTATLGGYTYTSKMTRVSLQLVQDAVFNLDVWLPRKQGERIGRAVAEHLAIGDGVNKPQGLLTGLNGGTTAAVGKVTFDDLITLEHSIDPAYRSNGRQRFLLSDSALAELRKLKDAQGQYIWQPSVQGGVASTILGHPYTIDNGIPAFGLGAEAIVFGDIAAAYVVRQIAGAQVMRLTERYADFLQIGFLAFTRLDAKVQDTSAAKTLTIKAA